MSGNIWGLLPVFLFMMAMLAVSIYLRNAASKKSSGNFLNEYFTGSRSLGGFVLAMTTVATYSSVSSFVGGPGQAWDIGFGWIYMSVVQVTALFLVLGILGKKMAIVSRKINAVTVIDVIRHRYQSDALANLSAVIIVLFFSATMVAQFVGGAKLFEAVTGYSYVVGLVVFGLVVVIYTAVGGFRGVAITDALCAIAMLIGMGILLVGILSAGGGYASIMEQITVRRPELLEPFSGGNMPMTLYISQWMLVGIFTVGLAAVGCPLYHIQGYEVAAPRDHHRNHCHWRYECWYEFYRCALAGRADRRPVSLRKQCGQYYAAGHCPFSVTAGGRHHHHRTDRRVDLDGFLPAFDSHIFHH